MKKLLFCGAFSSLNKGDEARIRSFISYYQRIETKDHEISFLSSKPQYDTKIFKGLNMSIVHKFDYFGNKGNYFKALENIYQIMAIIFYRLLKINLLRSKFLAKIKEYDVIIDFSGESFSDYFGQISLINTLQPVIIGLLMKKKIILNAQSIGPFNKFTKFIVKLLLNKVNLITVRDEKSYQYLKHYKINKPMIYFTADPAFLLEASTCNEISRLKINNNQLLIGFSVSRGSFTKSIHNVNLSEQYSYYVLSVVKALHWLREKYNAKLIFIPHVLIPGENDLDVYNDIVKICGEDIITCVNPDLNPSEMKGIIKNCDVFVGSRMHTIIAAISSLVPTIAIAYSHKIPSLMDTVGLNNLTIDIGDISDKILIDKIKVALKNGEEIRKILDNSIFALREKAMENAIIINKCIYGLKQ